jgi:DNA-binding transcriptional ArsR family regulator
MTFESIFTTIFEETVGEFASTGCPRMAQARDDGRKAAKLRKFQFILSVDRPWMRAMLTTTRRCWSAWTTRSRRHPIGDRWGVLSHVASASKFPQMGPSDNHATVLTYNQMVVHQLSDTAVDRIFQALADATRRDIIERSLRHEQSVSDLAKHYDMSFAAVQKHVAVLERALLVTKERRGREQIVHGNSDALRRAAELLDSYEQMWHERAIRIGEILSEPEKGNDK